MIPTTEPLAVTEHATTKVILVVEDDAATAELLLDVFLQETPYTIFVAEDSDCAFTLLRQITPDLLLLDYRLSETTGIILYEQLHAMRELQAVPAIILSASVERHTEEIESHQLPALAKPFEIDALLALIEEVFRTHLVSSSQYAVSPVLS